MLISLEVGYILGKSFRRQSKDEKESPVSAIAGAILGLGAFILAFTFSISADRFHERKELVRLEANAIRTAWQRSDFVPEPDGTESKRLLEGYLNERIAFFEANRIEPEQLEAFLNKVKSSQNRLWEIAVENGLKDMNSDVAALYIESLNQVLETHFMRLSKGFQDRIPTGIWIMLLFLTCLGMAGVGYQTGIANSKRSMMRLVLALSNATVINKQIKTQFPGKLLKT